MWPRNFGGCGGAILGFRSSRLVLMACPNSEGTVLLSSCYLDPGSTLTHLFSGALQIPLLWPKCRCRSDCHIWRSKDSTKGLFQIREQLTQLFSQLNVDLGLMTPGLSILRGGVSSCQITPPFHLDASPPSLQSWKLTGGFWKTTFPLEAPKSTSMIVG